MIYQTAFGTNTAHIRGALQPENLSRVLDSNLESDSFEIARRGQQFMTVYLGTGHKACIAYK